MRAASLRLAWLLAAVTACTTDLPEQFRRGAAAADDTDVRVEERDEGRETDPDEDAGAEPVVSSAPSASDLETTEVAAAAGRLDAGLDMAEGAEPQPPAANAAADDAAEEQAPAEEVAEEEAGGDLPEDDGADTSPAVEPTEAPSPGDDGVGAEEIEPEAPVDQPDSTQPEQADEGEQLVEAGAESEPSPGSDPVPVDECPNDPAKGAPGVCGCGISDEDSDLDEVFDCEDDCPLDPNKTEPGTCGCGQADSDADLDGIPDCIDECASDPDKQLAGTCGCGVAEAVCTLLSTHLRHRYSFSGEGDVLTDSVGNAHGQAVLATQSGDGRLTLAGTGSGEYATLPIEIVSTLVDASFEVWLEWDGRADAWERIFDIGRGGPVNPGQRGVDYLFLSVDGFSSVGLATGVYLDGVSAVQADVTTPLVRNTPVHVVVVFDDSSNVLSLYLDGQAIAEDDLTTSFAAIAPEAFWLGQSHYNDDPTFLGSYDEFRIYDVALGALHVQKSFELGPDAQLAP